MAYDDEGRLWTVNGDDVEYRYDANGNRTQRLDHGVPTETGSYDAQDRLITYDGRTYSYTANGELETVTTPGNDVTRYTYDVLGNLRRVVLHEGQPLQQVVIDYLIDGQNRRVGRKVQGIVTHLYVWEDDLRVSAILDGTGAVLARYVYGTRVNVPEYLVTSTGTYRLLTDHLGSVRVVVDVATGHIVQEREYDEWGRVTEVPGPHTSAAVAELQPFGFAGGLYDPLTKLVRFGARDYDAAVGRWTAKDPIRFAGRSSNLLVYASNDPVQWVDPEGTCPPFGRIPTRLFPSQRFIQPRPNARTPVKSAQPGPPLREVRTYIDPQKILAPNAPLAKFLSDVADWFDTVLGGGAGVVMTPPPEI